MIEKYAISHMGKVVIMKFNFLTLELTIGGYSKHRQLLENIISQYWSVDEIPEMKFSQRNKIRYTSRCVIAKYRTIIQNMIMDNALTIEQIHAHGRLM